MKFESKCSLLIEDTVYRYQTGGFLAGDIVKFRKNAFKNEKLMAMSEQYKAMVKNAMDTDLNLRVSSIKSIRPNTSGNYQSTDAPGDFYVDLVVEYAPGLWKDPITVPMEVLEKVETGINFAPVPDSLKRKNKEHKPEKVNTDGAERNLTTTDAKNKFAKEPKDGRSQAKKPKAYKESAELEDLYGNMLTEALLPGRSKSFQITDKQLAPGKNVFNIPDAYNDIDIESLKVNGIDKAEYPYYDNARIVAANWIDGEPLDAKALEILNNDKEFIYNIASQREISNTELN